MTSEMVAQVVAIRAAVEKIVDLDHDENTIRTEPDPRGRPQTASSEPEKLGLRSLWQFYTVCDGLDLPDIHVGYFVDRLRRVLTTAERGEPMALAPSGTEVVVFGSDGGGGRFATSTTDGRILYLPSGGAVHDGKYWNDAKVQAREVAPNLLEFLKRLRADVEAFVEGNHSHTFLSSS